MPRRNTVTFALLGVVLLVFMWDWIVDRMIFYPEPGVDLRPEQLGVAGEDVRIVTEDGVRIHAFFLPSPGATRAILFLHGNAGNASHEVAQAMWAPCAFETVRAGAGKHDDATGLDTGERHHELVDVGIGPA